MTTEGTPAQDIHAEKGSTNDQMVEQLAALNARIARQMHPGYALRYGILQGVGFMIGSTLLTAAAVSIILQFFHNTIFGDVIAWIAQTGR